MHVFQSQSHARADFRKVPRPHVLYILYLLYQRLPSQTFSTVKLCLNRLFLESPAATLI